MSGRESWILQVRERLASPAPRRLGPREARQASVLVPLFVDAGELWTLLTRRAETLPHHKGQIAFPGGGRELGEDPWAAALRETHEEIGIEPRAVLRLGELDEAETPSGFRIIPCVGAVPHPLETRPNPEEIDEVFAVPLSAFANPRLVEERRVLLDGSARVLRIYHVGSRQVWGLTARILQNLLVRLGLEPLDPEPMDDEQKERPNA
jgi:8-oxo-dGTP pyrophosphatase MutT (NUDIX family)